MFTELICDGFEVQGGQVGTTSAFKESFDFKRVDVSKAVHLSRRFEDRIKKTLLENSG